MGVMSPAAAGAPLPGTRAPASSAGARARRSTRAARRPPRRARTSRTTQAPSSRNAWAVGPAGSWTTTGRPLSPAADRSGTMGKRTRLGMPNSAWMRSPAVGEEGTRRCSVCKQGSGPGWGGQTPPGRGRPRGSWRTCEEGQQRGAAVRQGRKRARERQQSRRVALRSTPAPSTTAQARRLGAPWRLPEPWPNGWYRLPSASKYDMFSTTATQGTCVWGTGTVRARHGQGGNSEEAGRDVPRCSHAGGLCASARNQSKELRQRTMSSESLRLLLATVLSHCRLEPRQATPLNRAP